MTLESHRIIIHREKKDSVDWAEVSPDGIRGKIIFFRQKVSKNLENLAEAHNKKHRYQTIDNNHKPVG